MSEQKVETAWDVESWKRFVRAELRECRVEVPATLLRPKTWTGPGNGVSEEVVGWLAGRGTWVIWDGSAVLGDNRVKTRSFRRQDFTRH